MTMNASVNGKGLNYRSMLMRLLWRYAKVRSVFVAAAQ